MSARGRAKADGSDGRADPGPALAPSAVAADAGARSRRARWGSSLAHAVPWLLYSAVSGLLVFLSFPPADLGPVAFVAFVPLLVAADRASSYGVALACGLVAAAAAYLPSFAWIASVAVPGWLAVALYVGLYLIVAVAIIRLFQRRLRPAWPLLAALLWVGLELFRARLGPGFPWLFMGYTQYRSGGLVQLAALGGVYAVSFVVLLVNASLAALVLSVGDLVRGAPARLQRVGAAGLAVAVAVALLAGSARTGEGAKRRVAMTDGPVVGVIQQNLPRLVREIYGGQKTAQQYYRERDEELQLASLLSARLKGTGVRLVVWPESTVPVPLNLRPEQFRYKDDLLLYARAMRYLTGLAKEFDSYFLVGAPFYLAPEVSGSTLYGIGATEEFGNSAVMLSPEGRMIGHYEKIRLVPFGEYIPLRRSLPFLQLLTPIPREITPGKEKIVFSLPGRQGGQTARFSALVCYEDVFPDLCVDFRRGGAQFFVNVTEEGWYYIPGELGQHLAMAVFRAVETRTTVVRAANTGVSCFINPRGEVYAQLRPLTRGELSARVQLCSETTPYAKHGDAFAIVCLMLAISLPALLVALGRRTEPAWQ